MASEFLCISHIHYAASQVWVARKGYPLDRHLSLSTDTEHPGSVPVPVSLSYVSPDLRQPWKILLQPVNLFCPTFHFTFIFILRHNLPRAYYPDHLRHIHRSIILAPSQALSCAPRTPQHISSGIPIISDTIETTPNTRQCLGLILHFYSILFDYT